MTPPRPGNYPLIYQTVASGLSNRSNLRLDNGIHLAMKNNI